MLLLKFGPSLRLPGRDTCMHADVCVAAPLLGVEEGEDVLAGHEALLHVAQLEVVHLEHVLLLFLLQGARERRAGSKLGALGGSVLFVSFWKWIRLADGNFDRLWEAAEGVQPLALLQCHYELLPLNKTFTIYLFFSSKEM